MSTDKINRFERSFCTNRSLTAFVSVILISLMAGALPGAAHSNGWEHLAIPRETLLAALNSGDTHIMEHAAISIGIRGEKQDVGPLVKALDKADDDHHLRVEIYRALGLIGDESGEQTLLKALRTEKRPEVRAVIASSLGGISSVESIPVLLHILQTDHQSVRARAVDALGAFDHPKTIAVLSELANSGDEGSLKRRAIRALGATGSVQAGKPLLTALANASNEQTLAVVVDSLAQIAPAGATEPLTALLSATRNPVLQAKTAVALGAIGGDRVTDTLATLLTSGNRATQSAAVRMLAEAQSAAAAPSLIRFYETLAKRLPLDAAEVPSNVAAALSDLDLMKDAVRALLQSDPSVGLDVFRNAASYRHFDRNSAASLKLAHRVYELRRVAIHSLGYTGASSVSPFLQDIIMNEDDSRLRSVAMRSLGVLELPDAHLTAQNALNDEDASVRSTAATVLGRLGDSSAVKPLINSLSDPHPHVRSQAAVSLGLLNDKRAIAPLESLVELEVDKSVLESTRQALIMLSERP